MPSSHIPGVPITKKSRLKNSEVVKERRSKATRKLWNAAAEHANKIYHMTRVDTCCIDKNSSAELSEAINSMFRWYQEAETCHIYLVDVSLTSYNNLSTLIAGFVAFKDSRWFKKGWTLQELIAPQRATFYSCEWLLIGTKANLSSQIQEITGIDTSILSKQADFLDCSIAKRMSWGSSRQTTRLEDEAYCLLGLFDIYIPLQYGEGTNAFLRLQEELIKQSDDETIFAWDGLPTTGHSMFEPSVRNFNNAAHIERGTSNKQRANYLLTYKGLQLECQMLPCEMNIYIILLFKATERSSRARRYNNWENN